MGKGTTDENTQPTETPKSGWDKEISDLRVATMVERLNNMAGTDTEIPYEFFPNKREQEALDSMTVEDLVDTMRHQPDMTARFLHHIHTAERRDVAEGAIAQLATELNEGGTLHQVFNRDLVRVMVTLTCDFVPKDDIQDFETFLRYNGLEFEDPRSHIRRPKASEIAEADQPTPEEIQEYLAARGTSKALRIPDYWKEPVRLVDRNGRYLGVGRKGDYDWIKDVNMPSGFRETTHMVYEDGARRMATLCRY